MKNTQSATKDRIVVKTQKSGTFLCHRGLKRKLFLRKEEDNKDETDYYFGYQYLLEDSSDEGKEVLFSVPTEDWPEGLCVATRMEGDFCARIDVEATKANSSVRVRLSLVYEWNLWEEDVNPRRFFPLFVETLRAAQYEVEPTADDDDEAWYSYVSLLLTFEITEPLEVHIARACSDLKAIHKEVLERYETSGEISAKFNFPTELRYAYSEYLLHFGQFLEDIGVNADVSVATASGTVTLGIKPHSKDQALENIYYALAAYLSLSTDKTLVIPIKDDHLSEAKYQQLCATVDHLHSQLRLERAISAVKERELHLLRQTGANGQADVWMTSLQQIDDTEKSSWQPIPGVKIGKYKGGWFELDIPKLIAQIQALFVRRQSMPKN